jgi:hypothetical protein
VPLWDACEGVVVLWDSATRRLVWLDGEGAILDAVGVPVPAAELALTDVEGYLRQMARIEIGPGYEQAGIDFAQMARADRRQFPEQAPAVTDVRCESSGAAWLRLFDTEHDPLGRGQQWWRISAEGSVEPYRFTAQYVPFAFSERSVYGLMAEADGSQRLARWTGARSDS